MARTLDKYVHKVEELVGQAQEGDAAARDLLIANCRSFVARLASRYCGRSLDWNNDDELSIGLIAFNEAIDSFNPSRHRKFLSHAREVIHHRLVDHFRREARNVHLPLEAVSPPDTEARGVSREAAKAWEAYRQEILARERAEEICHYNRLLQEYGFSLKELKRECPKHRDTRKRLLEVARRVLANPQWVNYLRRYKRLPIKEIQEALGASRKVLETGRKYVIALTLIGLEEDLEHLRGFAQLGPVKGGEKIGPV